MKKVKKLLSLEQEIERALDLGNFIEYRASWGFVEGLDAVKDKLEKLMKTNPGEAMGLFDIMIAGCYEKAEEIDDSSGGLGMFIDELFGGWIKAAQAADTNPAFVASRILQWQEEDDYGFTYEIWKQVSPILNAKGKAAYRKVLEDRCFAKNAKAKRAGDGHKEVTSGADIDALKVVYAAQKDFDAFQSLAEQMGVKPNDCLNLAQILDAKKRYDEALIWVEKGLKAKGGHHSREYELEDLKRHLLKKLGRNEEALQDAWAKFEKHPSDSTYGTLMEYVPAMEKIMWHAKAVAVAVVASLDVALELLLKFKELERLAERVVNASNQELMGLSHFRIEPVAKALTKPEPLLAAKTFRALGMRILESKKSKYYAEAHRHFEQAKKLYEASGHPEEWQIIVATVRSEHRRKSSFIDDFERIAAGRPPYRTPTFQERIQGRLGRRSEGRST